MHKNWDYASTKTVTNNVHIHLWRKKRPVPAAQDDGPSAEGTAAEMEARAKRPREE